MSADDDRPDGPKVRITVVNDFPVVVAGLAAVLSAHSDRFQIVQTVAGRVPAAGHSDLVLFDAFAQTGILSQLVDHTRAKVVVFTQVVEPQAVVDALRAGAAGYIFKGVATTQLAATLLDIHHGSKPVVDLTPDPGSVSTWASWPGEDHDLNDREAEIVSLICRGLNNEEIAASMYLSVNSIKTYIRLAYRKMGVNSRTKAVVWGMSHGLGGSASHPG